MSEKRKLFFFIMSNRRLSSPYFRYFKARLWNLARPGFWGTAIFLSVVGLTIREFWMRPDMLTSRQSKPAATQPQKNSTLSAEDRAIVADIDNLSILEHDSKQAQPALDTAEPISQPKPGNQNPLEQAVKNQNTSNDTKLNSNVNVQSAPTPSLKNDNPFLTQAENLLQFGNPLRNGNNGFVGLNTVNSLNQSNQSNQSAFGLNQSSNDKSTQKLVTANSLETALNSSSLNPSKSQTPFGQIVNRNQSAVQPNNFLPSSNNINTVPQGINNFALPTQFAQPTTITQPQTVYSNLNGANLTQPVNYSNLNGANSTQLRTNSNFNNNNNNFNNILSLPNSNFIPQSTINTTPTTVTPNTLNSVTYPSATTITPSNTAGNGTLITPTQPNQSQQYPSQTQVPSQYPNSGLPVRY